MRPGSGAGGGNAAAGGGSPVQSASSAKCARSRCSSTSPTANSRARAGTSDVATNRRQSSSVIRRSESSLTTLPNGCAWPYRIAPSARPAIDCGELRACRTLSMRRAISRSKSVARRPGVRTVSANSANVTSKCFVSDAIAIVSVSSPAVALIDDATSASASAYATLSSRAVPSPSSAIAVPARPSLPGGSIAVPPSNSSCSDAIGSTCCSTMYPVMPRGSASWRSGGNWNARRAVGGGRCRRNSSSGNCNGCGPARSAITARAAARRAPRGPWTPRRATAASGGYLAPTRRSR